MKPHEVRCVMERSLQADGRAGHIQAVEDEWRVGAHIGAATASQEYRPSRVGEDGSVGRISRSPRGGTLDGGIDGKVETRTAGFDVSGAFQVEEACRGRDGDVFRRGDVRIRADGGSKEPDVILADERVILHYRVIHQGVRFHESREQAVFFVRVGPEIAPFRGG